MTIKINYANLLAKTTAVLLFTCFAFSSCKKDHDSTPPPVSTTIEGIYAGKQSLGPDDEATFKINLKAGGVFEEISTSSGSVIGKGTWQANGNTMTATYAMLFSPYSKYSLSGSYTPATKKLVGTWGFDNNPADGGTISLAK